MLTASAKQYVKLHRPITCTLYSILKTVCDFKPFFHKNLDLNESFIGLLYIYTDTVIFKTNV